MKRNDNRSWVIRTALMLAISGLAVSSVDAQPPAEPPTLIAATGNDPLQSSAERTMDFLNTEISQTEEPESGTGGLQLFSTPQARKAAIRTGARLTLVISLFLLVVFVLRLLSGRKSPRKKDNRVVSVLGQIPFVQGQQLQLVRMGTRLLLVATSSNGAQTLSEISDPEEVLQIEAAWQQGRMDLLTASLQQRAIRQSAAGQPVHSDAIPGGGRTLLEA